MSKSVLNSVAAVESAVNETLRLNLPAHLQKEISVEDAREWVQEHLEAYTEVKERFPDQSLLPWTDMVAYDDWVEPTFFVILILRERAIELFCGAGHWPDVRRFGEGEADDFPASQLHREWSSRFNVPCAPIVLGRGVVKKWLGREW